jgi:hypothetical protein
MHITREEAASLFESWVAEQTVLRVCFSRPGGNRELQARIISISGRMVKIESGSEQIDIDLSGAYFNGDRKASDKSLYGAYLVCESPNDDRWTFYAPRPTKT